MEDRARRLRDLSRALPRADDLVAERRQRLDHAAERLPLALSRAADRKRVALSGVAGRLTEGVIRDRIGRRRDHLTSLSQRLNVPWERLAGNRVSRFEVSSDRLNRLGGKLIESAEDRLARSARLLETLSYQSTLKRGYAVVRDADGALVSKAADVTSGAALEVQFSDDRVNVVASTGAPPAPAKPRKTKPEKDGDQGAFDL